MLDEGLRIGEFVAFTDEVEAAVVSGPALERCIGILGTRPPFRDGVEAAQLSFDDQMEARGMAGRAAGTMDVALGVGEIERTTQIVVISKSGALALRNSGDTIDNNVIHLIQELDGGNTVVACHARKFRIG